MKVIKRLLLYSVAALLLAISVTTSFIWLLDLDPQHLILRDGRGGVAGGSPSATYLLFFERGEVGVAWSHSDVLDEHAIYAPAWAILTLGLLSLMVLVFVWLKTRRGRNRVGFPVEGPTPSVPHSH